MKNIVKVIATIVMLALPTIAMGSPWSIDADHSSVGFKIRHIMISNVKGNFGKFSGTVDIDDQDLAKTTADVTIDVSSINTGVTKRDEHLKSADFFDVAKYPTMTFVSRKAKKEDNDKLKLYGQLTMHGVTKEVVLDVQELTQPIKDQRGNIKRGATASGKLNRKDFGLAWNAALESGGVMVGDEVNIDLEIELVKK